MLEEITRTNDDKISDKSAQNVNKIPDQFKIL